MGCLFVLVNLLVGTLCLGTMAWLGREMGMIEFMHPSRNLASFMPFFMLGAICSIILVAGVFYAVRRISTPVDSLLEAAGRVSRGDYTTPVEEYGPSEIRTLIRAFNGMLVRLRDTDTRRRNQLADLSHELRTPLTILRGNLEGMLDGVYPADEAHLKALLDEIHILERLVEDLRTLALAESGALELRREPTDLALLLQETAAAFQSSASRASFQVTCTRDLPLVNADPARLREVIANLLTNAVKHAPPGGIISLRGQPGSEQTVVIEVEDEGPGIPPEELPHVFERFYKASDSTGMGLGLSIARYLVEAHGGTIEATSPPGRGALIRVKLPI